MKISLGPPRFGYYPLRDPLGIVQHAFAIGFLWFWWNDR